MFPFFLVHLPVSASFHSCHFVNYSSCDASFLALSMYNFSLSSTIKWLGMILVTTSLACVETVLYATAIFRAIIFCGFKSVVLFLTNTSAWAHIGIEYRIWLYSIAPNIFLWEVHPTFGMIRAKFDAVEPALAADFSMCFLKP